MSWAWMAAVLLTADAPGKLPIAAPETVGMDAGRLAAIDRVVAEGLRREQMPGAVVLVGHRGRVVYLKAYGHRQLQPEKRPMTTDTVFDLASLTKPIATATCVMKLVENGQVELDAPVARYLPDFGQNGKERITVFHLLTHQGGLIADNALADYRNGTESAWKCICELKPLAEPGERFIYSDVGFIVLGELVRTISGKSLAEHSQSAVYRPLGMRDTGFLPGEALRQRAATTQQREGRWMCGEVHDPRAYALGGVAGHAGLFSTAEDLAIYAQMLIGQGQYDGVRILRPETVAQMTRAYEVPRGLRGLGWDKDSPYSSNRGDLFTSSAFGHGGFTGTAIWIDPELELFVIFLSNRVHPDGRGSVNSLAGRIGTIAAAAIGRTE